jgi:hypothetical protein
MGCELDTEDKEGIFHGITIMGDCWRHEWR